MEQRKRLTIAVELVANPSIVFMDEPTSGLDARAAAIVMRTVRNTVDTGRTVVCTIHQPSIDIFEVILSLLQHDSIVRRVAPCNEIAASQATMLLPFPSHAYTHAPQSVLSGSCKLLRRRPSMSCC